MLSFSKCIEIGSILFLGEIGSGKYGILGQIFEKFRVSPGAPRREPELQKTEFHNIIFRIPIIDCPQNIPSYLDTFENCKLIILIIDVTKEIPNDLIIFLTNIIEKNHLIIDLHIFLHKIDLLDNLLCNSILENYKNQLNLKFNKIFYHETSILDSSSIYSVSKCIRSILPKKNILKETMDQYCRSLDFTSVFLIDFQSRLFFLKGGKKPSNEILTLCQDAIDMFISMTSMMESRGSQTTSSIELTDNLFIHLFWSTYDVILIGLSKNKIPIATAKNNTTALFQSIKKILK